METYFHFQKRLSTLGRKHEQMCNGYTTQVRGDGLIVVKPKRRARRGFPFKGLVLLVLGFFAFKAFMLASMGDAAYGERIAKLDSGTVVEQAGAWVMQADLLTVTIAGVIAPLVR